MDLSRILRLLLSFLTWLGFSKKSGPSHEVDCSELLTRVLRNKNNLDENGEVTPEAFLLRQNDEGELSVFRQSKATLQQCKAEFKKTFGAASLHSGRVRSLNDIVNLGIDIEGRELQPPRCPGHAAIVNLPDHHKNPDTAILAERIATLLRDQCRLLPPG